MHDFRRGENGDDAPPQKKIGPYVNLRMLKFGTIWSNLKIKKAY